MSKDVLQLLDQKMDELEGAVAFVLTKKFNYFTNTPEGFLLLPFPVAAVCLISAIWIGPWAGLPFFSVIGYIVFHHWMVGNVWRKAQQLNVDALKGKPYPAVQKLKIIADIERLGATPQQLERLKKIALADDARSWWRELASDVTAIIEKPLRDQQKLQDKENAEKTEKEKQKLEQEALEKLETLNVFQKTIVNVQTNAKPHDEQSEKHISHRLKV